MNFSERALEQVPQYSSVESLWTNLYQALIPYVRYWIHSSSVSSWQGQEDDIVEDIVQEVVVRIFYYTQASQETNDSQNVSFERLGLLAARKYCIELEQREELIQRFSTIHACCHDLFHKKAAKKNEEGILLKKLFDALATTTMSLPSNVRYIVLVDLACRTIDEEFQGELQQAFQRTGIELEDYQRRSPIVEEITYNKRLLVFGYEYLRERLFSYKRPNVFSLEMKGKGTAMNTESDLSENETTSQSSWHLPLEHQSQQVPQGTPFPDDREGTEQERDKECASTSQPCLEDLDPQTIEVEEHDPELTTIAAQLRKTASYAINPSFKEELHKKLLQQFVAHHTVETKPVEGMDELLCAQLPKVATDIATLPTEERNALLSDLGKSLPIAEKRKLLEQAFQEEGLQLSNSAPHSYEDDFEHEILLRRAYRYIIHLIKRLYEPSRRKSHLSRA